MAEPYYPPNAETFAVTVVNLPIVGVPVQLPEIIIPDLMMLVIKNHPANLPAALIFVGPTASIAADPLQAYPLVNNKSVALWIKNSEVVWVSASIANSNVSIVVEQKKGK